MLCVDEGESDLWKRCGDLRHGIQSPTKTLISFLDVLAISLSASSPIVSRAQCYHVLLADFGCADTPLVLHSLRSDFQSRLMMLWLGAATASWACIC